MSYKSCAVPACRSTTIKTPEKLFVTVPKNCKVRRKWLKLANRDHKEIGFNSVIFFCQDHFDIEKDMANYYQYTMGFSQRIIMVDGVVPSKFYCQRDRRKRLSDASTSRPVFLKRMRNRLVQECLDSQMQKVYSETGSSNSQSTATKNRKKAVHKVVLLTAESQQTQNKKTSTDPIITSEKGTQINFKGLENFRSKAMQAKKTATIEMALTPLKHVVPDHFVIASCTPPIKIEAA